jgi:hypothetical protein
VIVAGVTVVFALGAWFLFVPLGLADGQSIPVCSCGDPALQVWFLAADHYAIVHHHLSLFSSRIDYPTGVNLMDNTSMPLLGMLFSPLTSAVGPVGTYVFLMRLGFFVSATSCFFVLRHYVRSLFAAGVGGALYGFSPYMTHQAGNHLFLIFVPIPPILFLLVQQRVFAGPRRRYITGVAVGLLAVVQYFISSEVLVTTVLLLAITVAIVGGWELVRRRPVWSRVTGAVPTAAAAAVVGVILLAYPAWYAIKGPQHIVGATQTVGLPGIDVVNAFIPASRQLLGGRWLGITRPTINLEGNTAYLGIPLLVILAVLLVVGRKVPVARFAAIFGFVAWVLALGPRLLVDGHMTKIPLPFAVLDHLPLLQDIEPTRLTLYPFLASSVLLAVGLDVVLARGRSQRSVPDRAKRPARGRSHHRHTNYGSELVVAAIAVVALVFVMPATGYEKHSTGVARYFLDGEATRDIPVNGVALTYPYPSYGGARSMIWQADAGLDFSILGGYAVRPLADLRQTKGSPILTPHVVVNLLYRAFGPPARSISKPLMKAGRAALPQFVQRYHVTTLLVDTSAGRAHGIVVLFRSVYGPPTRYGQLDVWPDIHAVTKSPAHQPQQRVLPRRS